MPYFLVKFSLSVLFIANMSDYTDTEHQLCDGNKTLEDFVNCVEVNTREFVNLDKPYHKTNRIYRENVMPVIQPFDGSIGFNETTALHLTLKSNTSYNLFFTDKSFAFVTLNPSLTPRSFLTVKESNLIIVLYLKVERAFLFTLFSN